MNYRNWDNHALRHECVKLSGELEQANTRIEALERVAVIFRQHLTSTCAINPEYRALISDALSNTKGQG